MSLRAVADELSVSTDSIDRYIRKGALKIVRLPSGRRRIAREDLDEAIQQWKSDGQP
jgi:excisionase family DNA binding protein